MSLFARLLRRLRRRLDPTFVREAWGDEFTRWLRLANPGMLTPANLTCFRTAIERMPSDCAVVEIGSFMGLSTNLIAHLLRTLGRDEPFFTADAWLFENRGDGTLGGSPVTHDAYRAYVREGYVRNVGFFSPDRLPHTVELLSDPFFEAWSERREVEDVFGRSVKLGGPIGFCYIDGDHTYEQSRRDFENVDRHLARGGFILFDDSDPASGFGSARTAREAAARSDYETVASGPNVMVRKR